MADFELAKRYVGLSPGKVALKAAQRGDIVTLRHFLGQDASLVNARDDDGYTPLHRAAYNGRVKTIGYLLGNGADVAARTDDGWEPLHSAARWAKASAVPLLVEGGGGINAVTNSGQTPLHLAVSFLEATDKATGRQGTQSRECVAALLDTEGIDISVTNAQGDTAAEVAARQSGLDALILGTEDLGIGGDHGDLGASGCGGGVMSPVIEELPDDAELAPAGIYE